MAEYYPLLSRAVSGLRDGPPEARNAIYERARAALLGQLRSMEPAVPERDIDHESEALDEAIARVEAEIAGKSPPAAPTAAAPSPEPRAEAPAPAPSPPPPPSTHLPNGPEPLDLPRLS